MKTVLFYVFVFLQGSSYCQLNTLLPPDSLLKLNKVKKAVMTSTRTTGNGAGETVYNYNRNGDLIKSSSIMPVTNMPFIITDYFFNDSGIMYASLAHGGEESNSYRASSSGYSMTWAARFKDSILYYYEYNKEKKLSRITRKYPSGELRNEVLYTYHPLTVTRRSYDDKKHLTEEAVDLYEKEEFIIRSMGKSYDSTGKIISAFMHEFRNTYNAAGQLTDVDYKNDTGSCHSHYKYYANGLIKSRSNIGCMWNKKFRYKYYR